MNIHELIAGDVDIGSMTDQVSELALRPRAPRWWRVAFAIGATMLALLVAAIGWLFYAGVGIWGIDWPVVWGFAIIDYVWWIAIASGGTFISALFYLMQVPWRTALNRIAETMTVFAAVCAGIFPVLHLGRPWFFYWLFPYPDTMSLWPQFRSPLLWDFFAILAYVTSSVLFWYLGLVPDFATLRDRARTRRTHTLYGVLALGFRGADQQWRHYRVIYGVLAAIMAPLVISVHSIVGLDFAAAATPGWHSTQFPPFFVFGALLSGFAMVLLLVVPLRRLMQLEHYITPRHLDILCRLLLMSSLLVGYAYLMDAFTIFYGGDGAERGLFLDKLRGHYAWVYWVTVLFNVMLPQCLWSQRARATLSLVVMLCLGVIGGMWCERFQIVVLSLRHTHLSSAWGDYHPTGWDWALLCGSAGLFLCGMLLAIRYLPVVSMFEMRALLQARQRESGR